MAIFYLKYSFLYFERTHLYILKELIKFFIQSGFSESDSNRIANLFSKKTFKRGEYVLQEGYFNHHLGFVVSGYFVFFVLDKGIEKTTFVVGSNRFVASLWSFLKEIPSKENIKCISKGEVWFISKRDFQYLQNEIAGFKDFYIKMLENEICCIEESRYDLITMNAEQRYLKLMQDQPKLLQNIPLKNLASILGITPRHLSRIRAKIV